MLSRRVSFNGRLDMKRKALRILRTLKYGFGFYEMKCEDCRYWCGAHAKDFDGFGCCQKGASGNSEKIRVKNSAMETKPDFCCKLWRLK